jgi:hypothetical protein
MSEYAIELIMRNGRAVIGGADDEATSLNLMDEAIRRHPTSRIRLRHGQTIVAERVPPRGAAILARRPKQQCPIAAAGEE